MINTWFAALYTLTLIGFIVLDRAAKSAPEGYEDESGFHLGRGPQMTLLDKNANDSCDSYDQVGGDPVEEPASADAA